MRNHSPGWRERIIHRCPETSKPSPPVRYLVKCFHRDSSATINIHALSPRFTNACIFHLATTPGRHGDLRIVLEGDWRFWPVPRSYPEIAMPPLSLR